MPRKARTIWELATPLNKSVERFLTSNLGHKEQSKTVGNPEWDTDNPSLWQGISALSEAVLYAFSPRHRKSVDLSQNRRAILEALSSGQLRSYGINGQIRSSRPVHIETPAGFWNQAEVNWHSNFAKSGSLRIKDIRVVDPNEPHIRKLIEQKRGRPSQRQLIYDAIEIALRRNVGFSKFNNRQRIEFIRNIIDENDLITDSCNDGFDPSTMRKTINEYLKNRN